jgi:hypothetical protein
VRDKIDDADGAVGVSDIVTLCVNEPRDLVVFDDSVVDPEADPVALSDLL